jgi:apolipoprotein N-acyltransferase
MGVEKMPLQKHFRFLEKYAMKLGGTYGSLGSQENREVFRSSGNKNKVAPVICYESVFGEFVGNFMQNGANILFIISNDGWFGNTAGHIHHLNYARLRAIETRRSVARCANTGISAFINQRGDILQSLGWWKRGKLTGTLNANNRQTFNTIYGDYPGLVSLFISITGIAFLVLKRYKIAPPRK